MKNKFFRNLFCISAVVMILFTALPNVNAENGEATDITKKITFDVQGFSSVSYMTNGAEGKGSVCENGGKITLKSSETVGSVYIIFNSDPTEWKIISEHGEYLCGENGFLHEYVDVSNDVGVTSELTLQFDGYFNISEIYVFSTGEKPDWVQVWNRSAEQADMLLFVAHSDDDQLFFAGLIPYYAAKGYTVQVAYLTYHPEDTRRRHELLNGLWTAGTKYYPFYGKFDDFLIEDLDRTVAEYERRGTSYEEIEEFVVTTVRRCKPLVVVSHDLNGEYAHGMHMLLAEMVCDAAELASDASKYTDSVEKYGTHSPKKTYLHLYEKNKLVLDIDTPMDELNGKTPFQVSQKAFLKHDSQLYTWFYPWLHGKDGSPITSSKQIRRYNPAYYGLYSSDVGNDTGKNDMFENVLTYRDIENVKQKIDVLNGKISYTSEQMNTLENELSSLKNEADGIEENIRRTDELNENAAMLKNELSVLAERSKAVIVSEKNGDTVTVIFTVILAAACTSALIILSVTVKRKRARKNA